jgi:DNA-binding GntR family transcriptional regulator
MAYAETLGFLKNNSLPSLVQEGLESMLRKGTFSPGDALREATLASQLGVSRGSNLRGPFVLWKKRAW